MDQPQDSKKKESPVKTRIIIGLVILASIQIAIYMFLRSTV